MDNIIIVAIITGSTTIISTLITVVYSKKYKTTMDTMNMSNHVLFDRIRSHERRVESSFSLENKGKELIWKDVLSHKFQIWEKHLRTLASETEECMKSCKNQQRTCELFYTRNMRYFNLAMNDFSNYYKTNEYSADEQKSLEITLTKFAIWHENRVTFMEDRIKEISDDTLAYGTCYQKQIAIFDAYLFAFSDTFKDAQVTIEHINGDLKGLVFKGVTI